MKKFLKITFLTAAMMMVLSRVVFAYVDPGAVTNIIAVIGAVVIAAGASVGIFWKKIKAGMDKKKVENAEKKIEREAAKRGK